MLNKDTFSNWLDLYGRAWEMLDPDAIIEIFSKDALYYETPYATPFVGRKGFYDYWSSNAQATQKDVNFGYDGVVVSDATGLAHWRATFTLVDTGEIVEIDGFLQAEFNSEMLCTCFREWWHIRESKQT